MDKVISKAEAQRRGRRGKKFWKSACCDADVVLGASKQLWCTVCFQDCAFKDAVVPAPEPQRLSCGKCGAVSWLLADGTHFHGDPFKEGKA